MLTGLFACILFYVEAKMGTFVRLEEREVAPSVPFFRKLGLLTGFCKLLHHNLSDKRCIY